jgi:hypothetical protein
MKRATFLLGIGTGFLAIALCLLTGCARVRVTHVSADDRSPGVHYYEPRPYLLVTRVGDNLTNQILWLPDPSQRYLVEVCPGWGTVDGSVKLRDGWMLDTFGAKSDSKGPETITAVGGLVTAVVKATERSAGPFLKEGLYLIEIGEGGEVSFKRTGKAVE